ncbi:MAG: type II toxin-antitoxin system prevent-host-death family antitoxin [Deinococcota bacterium]
MLKFSTDQLKQQLSEVIELVQAGQEVHVISDGKPVAVIIPYAKYSLKAIKLGLLEEHALVIHNDFKMTEEELLGS